MRSPETLLKAYLEACEEELLAFKPGNVSVRSEGHDMTVEDFRRSAAASGPLLCEPGQGLGERICRAVYATRTAVGCNTNLGIVLLAGPLILAAETRGPGETLQGALDRVLAATTVEDAEWVYRAIRMAEPGGLGEAPEQDVRRTPAVTLRAAMGLAEHRDRIAWQYTHSFEDITGFAIPRYHSGLSRWGNREWSAVWVYTGLLSRIPDSHVERKFGARYSIMIADRMTIVEEALAEADNPSEVLELLRNVDREFKSLGINPGTTADLTVACALAVRLEGRGAPEIRPR